MYVRINEAWADIPSASIDLLQAIFKKSFALRLNRSDDAFFNSDCVCAAFQLAFGGIYDSRIGDVKRFVRLLHPGLDLEVCETVCQLDSDRVMSTYSASLTTGGLGKAFA